VPTPERLIAIVIASIILLPFFLSFELLVRRGGVAMSTTLGVIGRARTGTPRVLEGAKNADLPC